MVFAIQTTGKSNISLSYDIMTIRNPYGYMTHNRINEATGSTGTDWMAAETPVPQEYIISAWTPAVKNILPAPRSSNDVEAPETTKIRSLRSILTRFSKPKTGKKSLPKPPCFLTLFQETGLSIQTIHNTLVIQGGIMKKTFLLFTLLLMAGLVFGQTYLINEGFESTTFPPTGWTNSPSGTVRSTNNPRTGVACLGFNGVNDAIYTPQLSNPDQLSFWYRRSTNTADWTLKVQVSTDASNWTDIDSITNAGTTYQQFTYDLSTYTDIYIRMLDQRSTGGHERYVDDFTVTARTSSPSISVAPASLIGFSYIFGDGPSEEQSFTVSGSNLTADISLTAPTNYEISLSSESGYTSSLSLSPNGGTVYVRLKAGLAVGDYENENITASSTGADDKTVTCSGSVTSPPPPDAPLATVATNVGNNGFTANWNPVSGATGYRLDVYTKQAGGNATDLFISEYIEGSSNNKYLEIYNGTGSSVDLSDYKLELFPNGASTANPSNTLSGTLTHGSTIVYQNSSAALTLPTGVTATDNSATNFNGDDAIALYKISTSSYVDIFGVIGDRPPNQAWTGTGGYSTENKTLVRKSSVTQGISTNPTGTGASAFTTLTTEWDMYPQDTASYLGSHTMAGGSSKVYVSGYQNLDVSNVTSLNITGLTPGTTYYYVVRAYNSYGTSDDSNEIEVTTTSTSPLITVSASALTDFTYMEGSGPSEEQSFTVSGSNLTANISLAAPTNYQISTGTGASFDVNMANPLVINQSGGSIAETTIYVRLQAGLTAGDYDDEVITASSTGADNKTVTCSGAVEPIPDPEISVTPTKLDGLFYIFGSGPSAVKTFKVSGSYLEADIEINASTNYEISEASGGPFGSYIALAPNNGVVAETTIYVRLIEGLPIAAYMGEQISISSDGADDEYVTLNGFVQTDQYPFCYWDFNVNLPADGANWARPIASNIGDGSLNYTFTKAVSFNGTQLNGMTEETLAGKSFAPQGGPNEVENNGENFIMAVDTSQLKDILMTYATQRTGTGFTSQAIWYSLDGGENFIHFNTFTSIADSWEVKTVDFTNVNGANNNPNFQVKIVLDGATSEAGNNRFDNIGFFGREDVNPVELSSFTATISAQNYITLTWVTQTETGMRGYYVFRAPANDLASAQIVSPMIESMNSSQQQTYIYEDRELYDSGIYYYWLQANDLDGSSAFHGPVSVVYSATGDNPTPEIPLVTQLHSAYPNPFNPTVFIPFSLAEDGAVSFKIYNSRGQMVKHFDLGAKTAGHHRITWDGTDYDGKALANGVYQIMMSTKNQTYQGKATLLK